MTIKLYVFGMEMFVLGGRRIVGREDEEEIEKLLILAWMFIVLRGCGDVLER